MKNINLAPLETVALFILSLVGMGILALAYGLHQGNKAAYAVLGGLVTVGLMALGGVIVIGILLFAKWAERGREAREQERFQDNARENLAIMQATARTQATQNAMLLRQGRELTRALPAPGDDLDLDALIFDNAIFDELDEGGNNHA